MPAILILLLAACGADPAEVDALRQDVLALRVQVENQKESLKLAHDRIELLAGQVAERPRPAPRPTPTLPEGAVAPVSDGHVTLKRGALDLANPDTLSRLARAIPHKDARGEIDGFRLSGIRRTGPLDALGFKNGDIVHRINGHDLSSTQSALDAYEEVRQADAYTVDITRRNAPVTLRIDLVD